MNKFVNVVLFSVPAVIAVPSSSIAQQPPKPAAPSATTELPAIEVTAQKKAKAAAKKKSAAPKAAVAKTAPAPQPPAPSPEPGTGSAATALTPVDGYVATQSAAGTKTDTPILETPKSINTVTRDQIEAQQPTSISQALRYTPGINVERYGATGIFEPIIVRGFEGTKYLDGLLVPKEPRLTFAQPFLDPYAFERIEVIKGPSSGLYGQSPPGGLINFTSKRPTFEPQNEVQLQFGSLDRLQAAFDFSGPLGNSGEFAYRLTGLARETDLQIDFMESERYLINPALTWQPNSDTRITVLGSAVRTEGYGPQHYVPFQLTRGSNKIPRSRFLGDPDNDGHVTEQYSIGYDFEHRINEFFMVRQNVRYSTVDHELLALRTEGLCPNYACAAFGPDFVGRTQNFVAGDSDDFATDTNVIAKFKTGILGHRVLAGVDYNYSNGFTEYRFGLAPPIDPFDPDYDLPLPPVSSLATSLSANTRRELFGAYIQDQVSFNNWRLTLGGRYDKAETKSVQTVPADTVVLDDDARTGFVGLAYVFDNGFVPYANYSTSFEPASGFFLVDSLTGEPLKPITGEGYEFGAKYRPLGSKTLISGAWFDITQQNVPKQTLAFETIQTGEVNVRGYELEIRSSLTPNIDIVGGYSNQKAEITEDAVAAVVGNRLPGVSDEVASLWAKYTWHEGMLAGLGIGGGVRYVSSVFAEDANVTRIPGYTLADATISYDFKYVAPRLEGLELQLNVTNLFDKYYVTTCLSSAAYCTLGNERAFLATATYRW